MGKIVSGRVVETTWKEMARASEKEARKWVKEMSREQPAVLAYLLGVDDGFLNREERELLVYLGIAVWRMMCRAGCKPAKVTEELLEGIERRNEEGFQQLAGKGDEALEQAAMGMLDSCQPELFRYVVEALMEEDEAGCVIRDDAKGLIMLRLMTVIEALDSMVSNNYK
ncbi:MAG: hypothetical protein ACPLPR_09745 [Bacillota bacterium]